MYTATDRRGVGREASITLQSSTEHDMYVLIVIFFQGGSSTPNAGFSQEFATREACHFAMNETKKAIQGIGRDRLVIQCVSKDKAQF